MTFTVIIPARYRSTRLPGKPLLPIGGVPMVVRVAQRARAAGAARVVVATDDERVVAAVSQYGFEALMTSPDHPTGTDRLAEAAERLGLADDAIVVNVQGDEPLLPLSLMSGIARFLDAHRSAAIATACHRISDAAEAFNPNVVKVTLDRECYALYFSRATIPWARDAFAVSTATLPDDLPLYRHYGLYAYRVAFLRDYSALEPAPLEQVEALEQLRALWHGYRIAVLVTDSTPAPGVDTADDLDRVRSLFEAGTADDPPV